MASESKPAEMEAYWRDVVRYPFLIGDFVWISQDYIGEAGIGKARAFHGKALAVLRAVHAEAKLTVTAPRLSAGELMIRK